MLKLCVLHFKLNQTVASTDICSGRACRRKGNSERASKPYINLANVSLSQKIQVMCEGKKGAFAPCVILQTYISKGGSNNYQLFANKVPFFLPKKSIFELCRKSTSCVKKKKSEFIPTLLLFPSVSYPLPVLLSSVLSDFSISGGSRWQAKGGHCPHNIKPRPTSGPLN